ncbi:hypothetical protein [Haloarchaeobius amylolyticus]|uniref:hypothetical protein n=1 Tax=Haloarchaeobius amylolyticus TaxID=1198296 RepID=UPI00226E12B8|nr:hypothetical protein [Haloarchaeobius amylolyticus]
MATTPPRDALEDPNSTDHDQTVTRLDPAGPGSMAAALQAVLAPDAELLLGPTDDTLGGMDLLETYRTHAGDDAQVPPGDTCTLDAVVAATPTPDRLLEYRRVLRPNGYLLTSLAAETGYDDLDVARFEPVLEVLTDGGESMVVLAQAA